MKVGDLVRLNDKNVFGTNYSNDGICVLGIVMKKIAHPAIISIQVHWFDRELTRIFRRDDYFDSNDFEIINERG